MKKEIIEIDMRISDGSDDKLNEMIGTLSVLEEAELKMEERVKTTLPEGTLIFCGKKRGDKIKRFYGEVLGNGFDSGKTLRVRNIFTLGISWVKIDEVYNIMEEVQEQKKSEATTK